MKTRRVEPIRSYTIVDLVSKLVGSIEPYGEANHDEKVLKNLDELELLLTYFVDTLSTTISQTQSNYQGSIIEIRKRMIEIINTIEDCL
jgi:hypothetical protein